MKIYWSLISIDWWRPLHCIARETHTDTQPCKSIQHSIKNMRKDKKNFDIYGIKIMIINHIHYLGCMTIDVRYVAGSNPSEIIWCYVMWKRTSYTLPSSIMLTMGTGVRWKLPYDGGRGGGGLNRLYAPS